ncbi:MAG: ABC transporter permease subunit [Lachnospiraceae bacterium]|nr:ABC transporter permease subunit [Lachnospiraceae bacterium]
MKKESVFHKIGRWFMRWFMGPKYEEKMREKEAKEASGQPDDSELIVSPGRQIFQRFLERKFAVFSVFLVLFMFLLVFIIPKTKLMGKYFDAYTEVTQKDMPPTLTLMSVPKELKNNIKQIDSYGSFSVGLSKDGKVYIWGATKMGATGLDVSHIPEEIQNTKIAYIAAGVDHVVVITEDGRLLGWGNNRFAQYAVTDAILENPNLIPVPEEIRDGGIDVSHVKKLAAGYQASALLMDDGTLHVWGNKQTYANLDKFVSRTGMQDVDFTLNYVVALDKKQSSIVTGVKNLYNTVRTEIGGEGKKITQFLNKRKIVSLTATSSSICILLDDGTMGLVGDFPKDVVNVPEFAEGEYVIDVEAGTYHFTCLTNHGHVYSFGGDHYRQAEAPTELSGVSKVFAGAFQNYVIDENGNLLDTWGLKSHVFGTDESGADILQRVIAGGAVTMTVGAIAVIIEILIGVSLGLISGYFGGWVDIVIMRVAEVFGSIPLIPFMLIMSSLLSQVNLSTSERLFMIMVILGILGWPGFARITRAQILVARESEYVTAAQAMGVKEGRIAFKHILPNIISVILVNMTLSFAASMQTETTLSFLGFGVNYPQPSWGNMLSRASNATAAINFPWQWIFTSAILVLTTVCINTIGDTLRDVMDPKSTNDK